MMAYMKRGTRANMADIVMKLVQTEYILGELALGEVRAIATSRNLPKPPVPERIAATRPPTSLPFPSPAFHAGT